MKIVDKYRKAVKGLELRATANGEKFGKCLQGEHSDALALSLSLYIKFVNTFQKHAEYINTGYCSVFSNMLTVDHRNIVNGDTYLLNLLNTDTPRLQ